MKRGFTIIELLVVMAIIAMLASVIVASLMHMQTKARDVRRMEDLSSLQHAFALYLAGVNRFPVSATPTVLDGTDSVSLALINAGSISSVAADPLTPDYGYTYQSNTLGTDYTITFCLETDSIPRYTSGCTNELKP